MLLSGIYKIKCKPTGKIYIGSAVNLHQRKYNHFHRLELQTHVNIHLQRSYDKYGRQEFEWLIIERCEISKLIEREQYYIDILNPKLNIAKIAGSSLGTKQRPETIQKRIVANTGKKRSKESLLRMSIAQRNPLTQAKRKQTGRKTFQEPEFRKKRKIAAALRTKNEKGQWS